MQIEMTKKIGEVYVPVHPAEHHEPVSGGTSTNLLPSFAGKRLFCTNSSAITITIMANQGSFLFNIADQVEIVRYGTGTVSFVAGSGVTLRSAGSLTSISVQFGVACLVKVATNEWLLYGSLV